VCGEERSALERLALERGTPPRVWGRGTSIFVARTTEGDTPTCVGKSLAIAGLFYIREGHPHVCGEETKENDMQPTLK